MDDILVLVSDILSGKGFVAELTGKWFIECVCSFMYLECTGISKLPLAKCACKFLFFHVNCCHVYLQDRGTAEIFVTFHTLVFFALMTCLVNL